uniref:Reverse transcriptase domain-containing protein n=1 Tax=Cyprinus carpio carpio TaxID=630221 RepID=A0A9J8CLD1_CYPCA
MVGNHIICMSWNIKGCGSPIKRGKVMTYLKHHKVDIAFIQETHFKGEEALKLKYGWVGHVFHSSFSSKRNGVVILVNKNLNFIPTGEVKDDEGRMVCVQATINGIAVLLCNIYAPNIGDPNFFYELNKTLGDMDAQIILAGDFNQVWDPFIDKSKFREQTYPKDRTAIHMMSEDNGLVDIWRLVNPREKEYTFYSHCHKSHSRIDMFLISRNMTKHVTHCKINAIALSDHAAVKLGIDINCDKERKGRWRLNTSLLSHEAFVASLKEDLKSFFEINTGSTDRRSTEWEASKAYVRGKIIAYASKRKREDRDRIQELDNKIKNYEKELSQRFSNQLYQDICKLKFELQEIYNKKVEYALFRLGTTFYEEGEKTGKLLARQLKQKNTCNLITGIKKGNTIVTSTKEINDVLQKFYKDLYTADINPKKEELLSFFSKLKMPKLSPEEMNKLEGPITELEVRKAVSVMRNGKSAGLDGLPVEYYKQYIDLLASTLTEVYNEAYASGSLPSSFNDALISVIPKKDRDATEPSNYRPISLINVDCKILSKILALRLEKVLSNIINPDQVGFMMNRSSTDNMRRLLHLIWLNREKTDPIVALSLDAEKAFDRVHWEFLFTTLLNFGFGPCFIKWVQTLYKTPKACVITNGKVSPSFDLTRGTRQGCPLSPLLFNITLEPLAIAIRANTNIPGAQGGNKEHKLFLYADDILALVKDPDKSLPHLMETVQSYSKVSGYKINWKKSEATPISGICNASMVTKFGFSWIPRGIKYLGIKISRELEEIPMLNLAPLLQNIRNNLDKWGRIQLTLWGKVNIIKMAVSSQLNYVLMMLPITVPQLIFNQYDMMVKRFLWNGKRPRIKLNKLCASRDKGGLGLPDPRLYQISFEMAKLAKHWNNNTQLDWVTIEKTLSWPYSPIEHLSQCLNTTTNPIMKHSREVWAKIHKMHKLSHCRQPYSSLWYNSAICVGKSPIYWKKWHLNGLCTVTDLFEQGVFLSYNNLVQKYNLKGKDHFWKYLQIRNCVSTIIKLTDGNHILDFLKLPHPQQKASIFYRTANHVFSNDCINLKTIWEKD